MKAFSFFSKKFLIYTTLSLVAAIAVTIGLYNGNGKQTAMVVRADVIQEVAATGKVKPRQSVDLGFDKSGRVGSVFAQVGDTVNKGEVIASLESGEVSADLLKARASLEEEIIKLREVRKTAPISYDDAYKNLEAIVKEGFADADNATRNKVDQFFKNISTNPRFEITITSGNFVHYFTVPSDTALELNNGRKEVEKILTDWESRVLNLSQLNVNLEANKAISDLNAISSFLDKMAAAVNTFSPTEYAYETTVSNYKSTISSARSDVSGAISSIVTAKDKLTSAPTLSQNGEFESVLTQEAKVRQAQAAVSSLEASLGKSSVTAPFDGVVILQDAKPGAAVSAGKTLISVISRDQMYVEANISEIHIGKVAVGNPVLITFDAFPEENFTGEVSYTEPGDVIIDGVVNYKIRVNLSNPNPKIKSGLTVNLKIQTSKRENVLALPLYAVTEEGNQNFADKIIGKETQKTPVNLGLSGNNGMVEILGGLNEGDMVEF